MQTENSNTENSQLLFNTFENIYYGYNISNQLVKNPKIILILHGWTTGGAKSWQNILSQIKPQIENQSRIIIAPDMPGFGNSFIPNKVLTAEDYADIIWNFLSLVLSKQFNQELNLSLTPLTIVGHSFGGAVASIISAKYLNNSKSKLILLAPAIVRNRPQDETKTKFIQRITKIGKKITISLFKPFYKSIKKIWYKFFGSQDYLKAQGMMRQIMQGVIKEDLQPWLNKINIPTTLVWGKKDTYTPISDVDLIKAGLINCKLNFILLPNIGHGIHLSMPELVVKLILE